jgi:hypothetical protein
MKFTVILFQNNDTECANECDAQRIKFKQTMRPLHRPENYPLFNVPLSTAQTIQHDLDERIINNMES